MVKQATKISNKTSKVSVKVKKSSTRSKTVSKKSSISDDFVIQSHVYVPEHILLSDSERASFFEESGLDFDSLPKIFTTDPAIRHLSVKSGDVIKILRKSITCGNSIYYRGVIHA